MAQKELFAVWLRHVVWNKTKAQIYLLQSYIFQRRVFQIYEPKAFAKFWPVKSVYLN